MSNIRLLIEDVMQLLSNEKITLLQRGATDLRKKYLAPGLQCKIEFPCSG